MTVWVDEAICVLKSLPVVSISVYAPPAHRRASGAASGGALGRSAPPRAARAPPFLLSPTAEKLPLFFGENSKCGKMLPSAEKFRRGVIHPEGHARYETVLDDFVDSGRFLGQEASLECHLSTRQVSLASVSDLYP